MILVKVTFWIPGPQAIFTSFGRSLIAFTLLSRGTKTSSNTCLIFEGLEQIILKRLGEEISARANAADAVPFAEP